MKFHENLQRLKKSNSHLCGDFNPFGCLIYSKCIFRGRTCARPRVRPCAADTRVRRGVACSSKRPKRISKNILKKSKRKILGVPQPEFSCSVPTFLGFSLYVGKENSENQKKNVRGLAVPNFNLTPWEG